MKGIVGGSLLAVFIAALAACASGPERYVQTASGYPEVTVRDVDVEKAKSVLVNRMQDNGYFLMDESQYRLVFTRQVRRESNSLFALAAVGNPYSGGPRIEIAYTLSQDEYAVRIIGFPVYSDSDVHSANRYYYGDDPRLYEQTQLFLSDLKGDLEAH